MNCIVHWQNGTTGVSKDDLDRVFAKTVMDNLCPCHADVSRRILQS